MTWAPKAVFKYLLLHPFVDVSGTTKFLHFFVENLVSHLVFVPFASLNFCNIKSFSCNLTNSALPTAIFNITSFTFSNLEFPRSYASALVTPAATTPNSGFESFSFVAPKTFTMIKTNRGYFMHIALTAPVVNVISTSILAMGALISFLLVIKLVILISVIKTTLTYQKGNSKSYKKSNYTIPSAK